MPDPHFIVIHGLASKPPKEVLAERFQKYLSESAGREIPADRVHLAYWADLMGYAPDGPDRDEYVQGGNNFRPYSLWERLKFWGRGLVRSGIVKVVESKFQEALTQPQLHSSAITGVVDSLPEYIARGPAQYLYDRFLPDLHRYFFGGRRNAVGDRFREVLRELPESAKLCLIAHSMGSIVAADVIIDDQLQVDTLITIGAPLGLKVVQEQIGATAEAKSELRSQVGRWFNLYDRLDVIALDSDLADDFDPMPVKDIQVRNEFVNREGERNHHKSYGYLRCPEMGQIIGNSR